MLQHILDVPLIVGKTPVPTTRCFCNTVPENAHTNTQNAHAHTHTHTHTHTKRTCTHTHTHTHTQTNTHTQRLVDTQTPAHALKYTQANYQVRTPLVQHKNSHKIYLLIQLVRFIMLRIVFCRPSAKGLDLQCKTANDYSNGETVTFMHQ